MIIACPACATRYVVPDSAIGVEGRTVRCAKCKHSWFQDGPSLAPPAEEPAVQAPPPPPPPVSREPEPATPPDEPEPAASEVGTADEPPAVAEEEPVEDVAPAVSAPVEEVPESVAPAPTTWDADPYEDDDVSHFDRAPPFRPRRNWLKVWTWAASIFAALALGTVVAASYWGLPDWVPVSRPTFAQPQADLVLEFPPDEQDRRTLPNGSEYFGVSGTVTNVGSEERRLPPLLIVLRDERERNVYEWEIAPPKSTLAPGETVAINEAATDIPKSAESAEFGWKPE